MSRRESRTSSSTLDDDRDEQPREEPTRSGTSPRHHSHPDIAEPEAEVEPPRATTPGTEPPRAFEAGAHYGWNLHPHVASHPHDPTYQNAPVLTEYLELNFVPSVVPQPEEYAAKEQARQYLEKLADQISPGAKLLPFGSMANGFALKNSDMDLCCFLGKDAPVRAPSELVELLGNLIERETNFYVKMLPRARIPIIKLTMPATPTTPEGMACDIGFENRLALENTRLLLTYAMIDPRLRTLVLFLKVWTKRRKINNPYRGTLSSYGYVLLVIHFLCHVKQPAVVPNLQRLPLSTTIPLEDLTYEGHDISFFDDLESLSNVFQAQNVESTGELLIDFFKYFANSFDYTKSVISIRSERGTLGKEEKGWNSDIEFDPEVIVRDLHKLCIEDPFALDYNVARTVTKDGLYTIRGEFMRAVRILTTPSPRNPQSAERVTAIMNDLCAEREDFLLMHPPPDHLKHHSHQQHLQPQPQQNSHHHLQQHHAPHHLHPQPQPQSQTQLHHANPSSTGTANHQLQPVPPSYNTHGSKSPRRRSVPSPHLRPAPPTNHQPQYGHGSMYGHDSADRQHVNGLSVPLVTRPAQETKVEQEKDNKVPVNGQANAGTGESSRRSLQAPAAQSYPVRTSPPTESDSAVRQLPQGSASTSIAAPAAGDSGQDRRQSWDGTQERAALAASAGTARPGSTSNPAGAGDKPSLQSGGTTNGYDLHRFFQNPPSSSQSDVGGPTAPSSHPRTTVSLTAPPSPDLQPSHFSSANHGYPNGSSAGHYVGRTPYRYPSSTYPSSTTGGPRTASSVPRNPHMSHHAYSNPYAASPAPSYPLAAPITSSIPNGTSTPPYPPYPLSSSSSSPSSSAVASAAGHSTLSRSPAPAPIFPAEDRERIARASSIMFGNFPELLPLPSYAHYHASGGSAAYLSGSGGWGVNPYGMSIPSGGKPAANHYDGRRGIRRSFGLSEQEDDHVVEADEEQQDSSVQEVATEPFRRRTRVSDAGRTELEHDQDLVLPTDDDDYDEDGPVDAPFAQTPLEHLSHVMLKRSGPADRSSRQRGRSVPQTRMGPDGRESILFGAIEVTLPKPEDVASAELEDAEKDQVDTDDDEEQNELREEEAEIANLGPSLPLEDRIEAPTTEAIPPQAIEAIPVVASTPMKAVPVAPVYAWRPLSPLFNSTPPPVPLDSEQADFDLDRTPRPISPTLPAITDDSLLSPSLSSASSTTSVSPGSDSPRTVTNGLELLSMTPPKSKHAAKRARQNERRKAAAHQTSSPTLLPTSNSMV